MIIVAGTARTGGSVMVRCLEASGFEIDAANCFGHDYPCQHLKYRDINHRIIGWFRSDLMQKKLVGHSKLEERLLKPMRRFIAYVKKVGLEVLKDPQDGPVLHIWIDFDPLFKEAKYIWMRRDLLESAKSMVRLQRLRPDTTQIPQWTVKSALDYLKLHEYYWRVTMPLVNHIEIWLNDLLEHTDTVRDRVSEFLNHDFDTGLVNKNETFARSRVPH